MTDHGSVVRRTIINDGGPGRGPAISCDAPDSG